MEDVDLGVCPGRVFPGDPSRAGIILPGANYSPSAPLLWFARMVLGAAGWTVLEVWDHWDRSVDPTRWARDRLEAALDFVGGGPARLVVAKSISTLALPEAAERQLGGVWLTPLCSRPEVRSGLKEIAASTLLVGGTADPAWNRAVADDVSGVEVLEIEGADHTLQYPDDPGRSLDALRTVVEAIERFLAGLE